MQRFLMAAAAVCALLQGSLAQAAPATIPTIRTPTGAKVLVQPVITVNEVGEYVAGGGGGGGGGDASAANQATQITAEQLTNTILGQVTANPTQYTVGDRLKSIQTTLGSPFQAGGNIGNTSFGISGTLPSFASTQTFNLGTLNGAATAANQTTLNGHVDTLESLITTLNGYVDTLEALTGSTNTKLDTALTRLQELEDRIADVQAAANDNTILAWKTDQTTHGTTDLVAADVTKVGGTTVLTGAGPSGSGSQRVALGWPAGTHARINMSTATTTQIVAASGALTTYVLFDRIWTNGTTTLTWVYGTGTNCGTGTTTLDGPYDMLAQTAWVEGTGIAPVMVVPASQALCLTSSAAVGVNGRLLHVQQ